MLNLSELTVLIKGSGEVASGIAFHLYHSRLKICLTEVATSILVEIVKVKGTKGDSAEGGEYEI
jgi:hypothetical protein